MYTSKDVTIMVGTSGHRFDTELPACLLSIAMQTLLPKKVFLVFDTPFIDLRDRPPYKKILEAYAEKNVEFEAIFANNAPVGIPGIRWLMQEFCKTEILLRVDDDHVLTNNFVEEILEGFAADNVVAVAPHVKNVGIGEVPSIRPSGRIERLLVEDNLQWSNVTEQDYTFVDHLHGAFAYLRSAAGPECFLPGLSKAGHREETYFSFKLKKTSGRLLVVAHRAMVFHFHAQGGTRVYDAAAFNSDEAVFRAAMLKEFNISYDGHNATLSPVIFLENGVGDHYVFRNEIVPKLRKHFARIQVACTYPAVFETCLDVKLVGFGEAKQSHTQAYQDSCNVYFYLASQLPTKKSLIVGYTELYERLFNITL